MPRKKAKPPDRCRYTSKPLAECNCKDGCKTQVVNSAEWIQPIRKGYRMECCDCGLAHILNFRIRKGRVQFQAFREDELNAPPESK